MPIDEFNICYANTISFPVVRFFDLRKVRNAERFADRGETAYADKKRFDQEFCAFNRALFPYDFGLDFIFVFYRVSHPARVRGDNRTVKRRTYFAQVRESVRFTKTRTKCNGLAVEIVCTRITYALFRFAQNSRGKRPERTCVARFARVVISDQKPA